MENIMDMVRPLLGNSTLDAVVGWAGESRDGTRRALNTAIPASIAGLADYARDDRAASDLADQFRGGDYPRLDGSSLVDVLRSPALSDEMMRGGQGLVQRFFGGRETGLVDGIAQAAGIGSGGVRRILAMVIPLIVGLVGKHAQAERLDGPGLSRYLSQQKRAVAALLPAPLASLFGVRKVRSARGGVDVEGRAGWMRYTPWILAGLAALVALVWAANRRVGRKHASVPTVEESTRHRIKERVPRPHMPWKADRRSMNMQPTEPGPLHADAERIEQYLDGKRKAAERFTLSGVRFNTGSARLDHEDEEVLDDIAQVLRDRPDAKVVIEGHTDSQGGKAVNRRLARARAKVVKRYLVDERVDADQLEAVSVGSKRPVKANDTEEHRAENRRIDVVVKRT